MFRSFDLRKVLILAFTSLSIGAVFLISSLNAYSTYQTARASLKETLATTADTVALKVDGYVNGILGALNAGVVSQAGRTINDSQKVRHQALIKILASHKGIREVWSVDEKGAVREFVSRYAITQYGALEHHWRLPETMKLSYGDVYFSDIIFTEKSKEPLLNVVIPLSKGGRLTGGMIISNLSLKYLWDVLGQIKLKTATGAFAMTEDGRLIGHSNTALVFSKDLIPPEALTRFFAADTLVAQEYVTATGKDLISGFSLIKRLKIGIVVEAPFEKALQAALQGILQTVFVSLLGILVSIFAAIQISRLLVKPILNLANAAEEISRETRNAKVEIAGTVETRKLGLAFNKMTQRLSETISQLETENELKIETEKVLRQSEERFRSLIENALDIISVLDADGRILFVSPSVFAVLGYSYDELVNRTIWDFVHPNDVRESENAMMKSGLLGNEIQVMEARFRHKDGSWHLLESIGRNMLDNPAVRGIVINSRDMTERLTLEEKLRRAQKMEAVGQLTSGIAHDFNNILGIIQGNLEILESMMTENEKARIRIEKAQLGVDRGTDITRKLLGFSRKDSEKVSSVLVNELVRNLEDLIARFLTASIDVKINLAQDLWKIAINPGEFEDAILNLSLNARDAMPHGGILLLETCNTVLDEHYVAKNPDAAVGEFVRISISDTGIGMTKEIQEKVLEPFFTTKEGSKGTGLGLSMVYGFIQRMGGHIKIYSDVGTGTTFQLYLPRARDTVNLQGNQTEQKTEIPGGSETILIVDDETGLRDIAVSYLEDLGYNTQTAKSGRQALDILKSEKQIDAVFSDVVMPGELDGYQLALAIYEEFPTLKVLLTSGFAKAQAEPVNGVSQKQYLDKLNIELLRKPYNKSGLAQALRKTLDLSF